jgi:hypothetical protein
VQVGEESDIEVRNRELRDALRARSRRGLANDARARVDQVRALTNDDSCRRTGPIRLGAGGSGAKQYDSGLAAFGLAAG